MGKGNENPIEYSTDMYNYNNRRSNQLNPNNTAYWKSRGYYERPDDWADRVYLQSPRGYDDNRSSQRNPNNPNYYRNCKLEHIRYNDNNGFNRHLNSNWKSRGYDERFDDWEENYPQGNDNYRSSQRNPKNPKYYVELEQNVIYEDAVKKNQKNRSEQLNPSNRKYWSSRGYVDYPDEY